MPKKTTKTFKKTNVQNLAKLTTSNGYESYHARFRRYGKEVKCFLSEDFYEAKEILKKMKMDESLGTPLEEVFRLHRTQKEIQAQFTFNDLFKEYIHLNLSIQSYQEIKTKRSFYKNHIYHAIGSKPINKILYVDCQRIINNVLDVKELKPKTAKNIKAHLQAVFNYAIQNQYLNFNPASLVTIPAFDNKMNLEITISEARNLLDSILKIENQTYRLIFLFALHGRRLGEILNMKWYQIEFTKKEYFIPAQKNKAKKHQSHSFTQLLEDELITYYVESDNKDGYLFVNPNTDKPFVDIRRTFKNLKKYSDITNRFRFHDFRHLLATIGLNECDISLEKLSHALGHSSLAVTEDRYITRKAETSKNVVDKLLNFLSVD